MLLVVLFLLWRSVMEFTFITAPEKLMCIADEHDSMRAAWERFKSSDAKFLLVMREGAIVGGLSASAFRNQVQASASVSVGDLPMRQVAALPRVSRMSEVLRQFDDELLEAVVLVDHGAVVSAMARPG